MIAGLQGWTLYEIIRNAPGHNWLAYEAMLSTNPVFAKMCISCVVYAVGDLSAQVRVPTSDSSAVPVAPRG